MPGSIYEERVNQPPKNKKPFSINVGRLAVGLMWVVDGLALMVTEEGAEPQKVAIRHAWHAVPPHVRIALASQQVAVCIRNSDGKWEERFRVATVCEHDGFPDEIVVKW